MSSVISPFTLAACAEMLWQELPLIERVRRIHERGLEVEIWDWTKIEGDLDAFVATGATFGSMTGYVSGTLTDPDGIQEFLSSAERSIQVGRVLGVRRLNLHGTGLGPTGLPVHPVNHVTGRMWAEATLTLQRLAELGEREDAVFTLENLNVTVDHPGCPFGRPEDTRALVATVNSPHVRMNLDLYHAQIGAGQLIESCRESLPWIGEIQVADVPGRCEPGTGEINYPNVAKALHDMGYRGVVAMEAWASSDSDAALDSFVSAFSLGG